MIKYHRTFACLTLTLIKAYCQIYHALHWQENLEHPYWWRIKCCTIFICISFSSYKRPPLYSCCMVGGFAATYLQSLSITENCEFEFRSCTLCNIMWLLFQWLEILFSGHSK